MSAFGHGLRSATVALASAAAFACSPDGPAGVQSAVCPELSWSGESSRRSVVLMLGDTMRRDRFGAYGGPASTPHFDAFAREHLRFDRASSSAPWTKPAMVSLFTALLPAQHGVLSPVVEGRPTDGVAPGLVTLAEVLQAAGYETAAFVANPWLQGQHGFAQGFDLYEDGAAAWDADGEALARAGLQWLAARDGARPFFLYLHGIDSHRPHPPLEYRELAEDREQLAPRDGEPDPEVRRKIANLVRVESGQPLSRLGFEPGLGAIERVYDKGLARADAALGVLLAGLRERDDWSRTALFVTSDHGEALFERGYGNHSNALFEEEIAVPLAARMPGVRAADAGVGCDVGLVDWMPTLCEYLGLDCPDGMAGASWLSSESSERVLVAEGVHQRPDNRAARIGRYKLLFRPNGSKQGFGTEWALFDLDEDPGELENRIDDPALQEIRSQLERAVLDPVSGTRIEAPAFEIDPQTRERLEALGYTDQARPPGREED